MGDMMEITAVLMDVSAIQQYVFGSNKLKENLGASYLVGNIYEQYLNIALKNLGIACDLQQWETAGIKICDQDIDVEIGYIGGGNALLFFKDNDQAVDLAKEWTKILLVETPGLVPSITVKKIECSALSDKNRFSSQMDDLFGSLQKNKNEHQPQTTLPRHGITAECSHTGLSAECYDEINNKYISSVAMAKIRKTDEANKVLLTKFHNVLGDMTFPMKLEELGQREGDSHISIVHIDGNNMGLRFQACKTLEEIRALSKSVREATERSFEALLKYIINHYESLSKIVDLKKNTLPIRPIILGGDDITFISHGKFGIHFARVFLEAFTKQHINRGNPLSACAGIAITRTKYPFYRGYQLSEDLCKQAKIRAHNEPDNNSSWLDFHIAYGGFSGSIEDIRKNYYTAPGGPLCLRPYRITKEQTDHLNLSECLKGIQYLSNNSWPRSKLKELREVLTLGPSAVTMFISEMEYRGKSLPDISGTEAKKTGWLEDITPYFDMLELMEFYPMDLITMGGDV
jgi:hypothetical protein